MEFERQASSFQQKGWAVSTSIRMKWNGGELGDIGGFTLTSTKQGYRCTHAKFTLRMGVWRWRTCDSCSAPTTTLT